MRSHQIHNIFHHLNQSETSGKKIFANNHQPPAALSAFASSKVKENKEKIKQLIDQAKDLLNQQERLKSFEIILGHLVRRNYTAPTQFPEPIKACRRLFLEIFVLLESNANLGDAYSNLLLGSVIAHAKGPTSNVHLISSYPLHEEINICTHGYLGCETSLIGRLQLMPATCTGTLDFYERALNTNDEQIKKNAIEEIISEATKAFDFCDLATKDLINPQAIVDAAIYLKKSEILLNKIVEMEPINSQLRIDSQKILEKIPALVALLKEVNVQLATLRLFKGLSIAQSHGHNQQAEDDSALEALKAILAEFNSARNDNTADSSLEETPSSSATVYKSC